MFPSHISERIDKIISEKKDNYEHNIEKAIINNDFDSFLINLKLNPSCIDMNIDNNESLISFTFVKEKHEMFKLLLECNIDLGSFFNEYLPVFYFSATNRTDILKLLVSKGASVYECDENLVDCLSHAVINNRMENVKLFLENEPNLKSADNMGWTALHYAASRGRVDMCKLLVENGAPINILTSMNESPLYIAIKNGQYNSAKLLLEMNANPNCVSKCGKQLISLVIQSGNNDVLDMILEKNVNVEVNNEDDGYTPLHCSIISSNQYAFDKLICKVSTVDILNNKNCETPLITAASVSLYYVQKLVEKGATIDMSDGSGQSAIYKATFYNKHDIIRYLAEHKADMYLKDFNGINSLMLCSITNNFETLKLLLEYGLNNHGVSEVLFYFSKIGKFDFVKYMIEKGVYYNITAFDNTSIAHLAVVEDQNDFLDYILKKDSSLVNMLSGNHDLPITLAIQHNRISCFNTLLKHNANLQCIDTETGETLLHYAARYSTECLKMLIDKGLDINANSKNGTPLCVAACYNNSENFYYLLEKGATIDKYTFIFACRGGNYDIFKLVADKGYEAFDELLLDAAVHSVDIVKYLLDKKCSVKVVDGTNNTPLLIASLNNKLDIVKVLVEAGSDIDHVGEESMTALHHAAHHKNYEMIKFLLEHKAQFQRDVKNWSPIMLSAKNNDLRSLKLMLENGASLYESNDEGDTLVHIASKASSLSVLSYLVLIGADINVKNIDGRTPLVTSVISGQHESTKILINANADESIPDNKGKRFVDYLNQYVKYEFIE